MTGFGENDNGFPADVPCANQALESPERPRAAAAAEFAALDSYFNFPGWYSRRQPTFSSHGQAFPNGISNVCFCVLLRTTLADASGNGRTLGNIGPVFVLINDDLQCHSVILACDAV